MQAISRNRVVYASLTICVVAMGLASRRYDALPSFVQNYAGDTLWALMVFLAIGFLFPRLSTFRLAALALIFAFCIEFSQIYHAPWIDSIRYTRLGGLVLGFGFLWSDLFCYFVGIATGMFAELFYANQNTYR